MRAIGLLTALLAFQAGAFAQPVFRNAGAGLAGETWTNRVIESGENVTVSLALKNVGEAVASNLTATIQPGNGVSVPPPPQAQSYGLMAPCAPSVAREFSFKATSPAGSLLNVNLALDDSGRSLGTVTFRFRIGPQIASATNSASIEIYTVGEASTYPSIISVSNTVGTITAVAVTLSNLSHTFPDDLDVLLVNPFGDSVMLMSDVGGDVPYVNLSLTFSDDGQESLPDVGPPVSRSVRPTNFGPGDILPLPAPLGPYASVLSAFNGKAANGDWKLYISDDTSGDVGMLEKGWSLRLAILEPIDDAPALTFLGRTTNNMIRFAVSGRPSRKYAIETSPDPFQSFPLETFMMPTDGMRIFEYPLEPEDRFFRAATEP